MMIASQQLMWNYIFPRPVLSVVGCLGLQTPVRFPKWDLQNNLLMSQCENYKVNTQLTAYKR